jgi:hypothetical protein
MVKSTMFNHYLIKYMFITVDVNMNNANEAFTVDVLKP